MKFFVENQETNSRWEMELDADKQTVNDLLNSEDWSDNIEAEYLSEDWSRRSKGFVVFGLEDDEVDEVAREIKIFFEEQGIEVDDIVYLTEKELLEVNKEDDEYEEDDEYGEDLFDEFFSEDY